MKTDRNGFYKVPEEGKLWPCRGCFFEEQSGKCLGMIVEKGIYDCLGSCSDGTIYKKLTPSQPSRLEKPSAESIAGMPNPGLHFA